MKTRVVFRVDSEGIVFALFPDDIADPWGNVTCYQHVGQHCAADYAMCIETSRPARPDEFKSLWSELEQRGYDLTIITRANPKR
jgi:hypothetical protein